MNIFPKEYDAGLSPSEIMEAKWRTTQHTYFKLFLNSKEGVSLYFERIEI
jgi:hypothetical protein